MQRKEERSRDIKTEKHVHNINLYLASEF
jgi:hypothetical protein